MFSFTVLVWLMMVGSCAAHISQTTTPTPTPTPSRGCNNNVVYNCDFRFASPVYNSTVQFLYQPPVGALASSWAYSRYGGSAMVGSIWDNAQSNTPPGGTGFQYNNQYAFLQTGQPNEVATMSTGAYAMETSTCSTLLFTWSVRNAQPQAATAVVSQFSWSLGSFPLWSSGPTTLQGDPSGWAYVTSTPFYPTTAQDTLTVAVTSASNSDQTVLIGSVMLAPYSGLSCCNPAQLSFDCLHVFATPTYGTGASDPSWSYSPAASPWIFAGQAGPAGIARLGSPWDNIDGTLPMNNPPGSNQYAFFLLTGAGTQSFSTVTMSTNATGLQPSTCSYLSFAWSVRKNQQVPGTIGLSAFQWSLGSTVIWTAPMPFQYGINTTPPVHGWTQVNSPPFKPSSSQDILTLLLKQSVVLDTGFLIGSVRILPSSLSC